MTKRKPREIGTHGESAVLKQILPYFPTAERLALKGDADQGDIGNAGDFIFEVKAGKKAQNPGDALLNAWIHEALAEAANRGVGYGVLVLQRAGYGEPRARRWWVYVTGGDLAEIMGGVWLPATLVPIRMELGDFLDLLGDQGYTPGHEAPEPPAGTTVHNLELSDALADPTIATAVQDVLDGTSGGQLWTGELPIVELEENPNPRIADYAEETCGDQEG